MKAEEFFRQTPYWRAWSDVPDSTADIPYAVATVGPGQTSVLDIPCGRGRLLNAIKGCRPGVRLFGVDVNSDMIRQTRAALPGAGAGTAVASVYAIPFPDRVFDVVLCHDSFMHFDNPRLALAEITRVARSSVYFSVTTRRQLNNVLRRVGLLKRSDVPHWGYNVEDIESLLPREEFAWKIVGAFLVGHKALRLSHAVHRRLHALVGRRLPQLLLHRFGQTLFIYGRRIVM